MSKQNITVTDITSYSEMEEIILKYKDTYFLRAITNDEYRDTFIKKHLENGHFIAEYHDGTPVGFASFYCNDGENKKAFISSFVVNDNLGFLKGKTLIRLLKTGVQIAQTAGMETVELEVEKDNDKALKLYKHLGFTHIPGDTATTIHMKMDLNKLGQTGK